MAFSLCRVETDNKVQTNFLSESVEDFFRGNGDLGSHYVTNPNGQVGKEATVGGDNRKIGDTFKDTAEWIDFFADTKHRKDLDMTYEVSISLEKLGITKADIESRGVGVLKVSTFGTSGMDCLPYDASMSDNADKPYSKDPSTSMEKEDEDHITAKLAKIGKL